MLAAGCTSLSVALPLSFLSLEASPAGSGSLGGGGFPTIKLVPVLQKLQLAKTTSRESLRSTFRRERGSPHAGSGQDLAEFFLEYPQTRICTSMMGEWIDGWMDGWINGWMRVFSLYLTRSITNLSWVTAKGAPRS